MLQERLGNKIEASLKLSAFRAEIQNLKEEEDKLQQIKKFLGEVLDPVDLGE